MNLCHENDHLWLLHITHTLCSGHMPKGQQASNKMPRNSNKWWHAAVACCPSPPLPPPLPHTRGQLGRVNLLCHNKETNNRNSGEECMPKTGCAIGKEKEKIAMDEMCVACFLLFCPWTSLLIFPLICAISQSGGRGHMPRRGRSGSIRRRNGFLCFQWENTCRRWVGSGRRCLVVPEKHGGQRRPCANEKMLWI